MRVTKSLVEGHSPVLSVPSGNRHHVPEEHTVLAQFQPLLQTIGACPSQFAWRPPADMCQAAHVSPGRCCWEESGSNCTQVPRARVWQFRQRCHHLRQLGQQAQAALANTFSCVSETISFTMGIHSFIGPGHEHGFLQGSLLVTGF